MKKSVLLTLCVIGLLLPSMVAYATIGSPLSVKVTSGGKTATWTYAWTSGQSSYTLGAPVQLKASDNTILGYINSLSCGMAGDPVLTLNYAFQSVGAATFTVDSGELSFATIASPVAFATAASTLTAGPDGATYTGNFTGNTGYEATYNGGTVFADLDGSFTSPSDTSTTENDRLPPGTGVTPIAVPVSSMRAQWNFTISADTGVSGTSRYDIEPVPDASTLALAFSGAAPLLAGLALRRRRAA